MDNYNYPAGADTSDAPWNEREYPALGFDVEVSVQLVKTVELHTTDYFTDTDLNGDDLEDFHTVNAGHDWEPDYEDECYTIPEMLEELQHMIEKELATETGTRRNRLRRMLGDCQGWKQEEFYAEEL